MYEIYSNEIQNAKQHSNTEKQYNHSIAITRSLSQLLGISLLHICFEELEEDIYYSNFNDFFARLSNISDGLPFEIIERCIFLIKDYTSFQDILQEWYRKTDQKETLSELSQKFVKSRNDAAHTIIDSKSSKSWADQNLYFSEQLLNHAKNILPSIHNNNLEIKFNNKIIQIHIPFFALNQACIIRKINNSKGIQQAFVSTLNIEDSRTLKIEFSHSNIITPSYALSELSKFSFTELNKSREKFTLIHNIPKRQTITFKGRENEIREINEWLNDSENKILMIFGDGGFGKTTLLLEYLNRILDDEIDCPINLPDFICFYSSKMTRWGEDGLIYIKGITDSITDGIKKPLYLTNEKLEKSIHGLDALSLIDRVSTELSEQGLKKENTLLIFDNTETLTTSTEGAKELGEILKKISRKIGRVIITTRRREFTAADSIEVSGLTEDDSVELLNKLAENYSINQIKHASKQKLKKISSKLLNKPILLETYAKHLARTNKGLEETLDQIFTKNSQDLLSFLYEDAWSRISEDDKKILISLSTCIYPLTESSLAEACRIFQKPVSEFEKVLDETYFTKIINDENQRAIEVLSQAKKYFEFKLASFPLEKKEQIKSAVSQIDDLSMEEERIKKEYSSLTNADAHRSLFAKAAKIEFNKGDIKKSNENYQLALDEDPLNPALHEFYARFCLNHLRNTKIALEHIDIAVELDSSNSHYNFTKGLIYYRNGNINKGDEFLNKSLAGGKQRIPVLIEKAVARYFFIKKDIAHQDNKKLYHESIALLKEAISLLDKNRSRYSDINLKKSNQYLDKLSILKNKFLYRKNQ